MEIQAGPGTYHVRLENVQRDSVTGVCTFRFEILDGDGVEYLEKRRPGVNFFHIENTRGVHKKEYWAMQMLDLHHNFGRQLTWYDAIGAHLVIRLRHRKVFLHDGTSVALIVCGCDLWNPCTVVGIPECPKNEPLLRIENAHRFECGYLTSNIDILPRQHLLGQMASDIIKQRAWGDCPILADVLEEDGFGDQNVLNHLRRRLVHIGCCRFLHQLETLEKACTPSVMTM